MFYLITKMIFLLLIALGLGVALGVFWHKRRIANALFGSWGNMYADSANTEERLDGVKKSASGKGNAADNPSIQAAIPDSARMPLSNDPFINELDQQIKSSTASPAVSASPVTSMGIAPVSASDEKDYERMKRDFAELQSTIGDLMHEVKNKTGDSDVDGETTASQMSSSLRAIQEKVSFFEKYMQKTRSQSEGQND